MGLPAQKHNSDMTLSQHGLNFLRNVEGLKLTTYRDLAGYQSIGIGHKLLPEELRSGKISIGGQLIPYKDGITQEQADTLKRQDLVPVERAIREYVRVSITQSQFDALVSFAFNVGTWAFLGSSLLRKLNEGSYSEVPSEMKRWDKISTENGEKVSVVGLATRRRKEADLWALT